MKGLAFVASVLVVWAVLLGARGGARNGVRSAAQDSVSLPRLPPEFPQLSGDTTLFVPNALPVFIDGRRVDAVNGGHTVTVNHVDGILVDGVVYMTLPEVPPPPQPATLADGFGHYVIARAAELAIDAMKKGASPAEARRIMLDFWAQYPDSIEIVAGEHSAEVTYRSSGRKLYVEFPGPMPKHPPRRPTPFELVVDKAEFLVDLLRRGELVIQHADPSGGADWMGVRREDATRALEDLSHVAARAEVLGRDGDKIVYKNMPIAGGKYRLPGYFVADFVRSQREGGQ